MMACEEPVPVSTLSSLHQHCNNKIAWFRNGVAAEHHEWLSTFLADARSSLLKSSEDEPISVLPPRTPHAPRKRRCVEERRSSPPAERSPIRSPAEQTVAHFSCHTPDRHPSPAAPATAAASSRRSHPVAAAAAEEPMDVDNIVAPTPCAGGGHTVKFASPSTPSPAACSPVTSSPEAEEERPSRAMERSPVQRQAPLDGCSVEEECDVDDGDDDVVVVSSSSSASSLTQESVHALEEETGSAHRMSTQSDDSFVTAAADLRRSVDEPDNDDDVVLMPPPPSEPLPVAAAETDTTTAASKRATPKSKPPLKATLSTPVVSLTPMEGRVMRSGSCGSATSRMTRGSHTSTLADDLAASPMPSCYGIQAGAKATPMCKEGGGSMSSLNSLQTYMPPSASRILRSALRKHGAEADSDLQRLKNGGGSCSSVDSGSSAIRFGAPLRALQNSSPGNSDNEGDDDHPKVLRRLNNIVSSVTSLIPHSKTPKKMDSKAKQDKLKAELDAKQKQTDERKRKKEEQRVQDLEEKKQKRAERERLNRKRKADMEEERNAKLLKKTDSVPVPPVTTAPVVAAVQKKKAQELEEQRRKEQRKMEAEVRRRQEEEAKAKKRTEAVKKFPAAAAGAAASISAAPASSSLRLQSPHLATAARAPAPKNVSALASAPGTRTFGDANATRAGLGLGNTPGATAAGTAGTSSANILKKALSRTTPSAASSSVRLGDKKTPSANSSASQDSGMSVGSGVASGSVRPPTPSCSNIVKSFPAAASASAAIKSGVSSIAKSVGLSSSSSASYTKQAPSAGALGAIQEAGGKKTMSISSTQRSPLKALNKTYTKPVTSAGNSAIKSKPMLSPMPTMGHGLSRSLVPSTPNTSYNDYGIDDIESDDPTDDEESPRRKIPKWAQQGPLKRALIDQEISGDIADQLFPVADLETPNLTRIFQRERQRYLKRTSSAIWSSPLIKRAA